MAVHAAEATHPRADTGAAERAHHPTARFYVLIFLIPLLVLAIAKFSMIAAFYMHLKQDSRVFSAFFITGLILAIGMWGTFMGLFTAHYREPFDQITWREEIAKQSGTGAATAGEATGGGK